MIYSDTEFYYTTQDLITKSEIILDKEETKHLSQVMRHSVGDEIFVTDGVGNVYRSKITHIAKNNSILEIISVEKSKERFPNIFLFIPILKSSDRFEFALEKSIELGITNIVVYSAKNSHKRGVKLERWRRIGLAAMKQSLQAFKPNIQYMESLDKVDFDNSTNFIFDQLASKYFSEILPELHEEKRINLIFGPEAGLNENEKNKPNNSQLIYLTKNRLRAETAIISAISFLSTSFQK